MDGKEIEDVDDSAERGSQCCIKCWEWEERFTELKSELERKMSDIQNKLSELSGETKVIRNKVESSKPEDARILELMMGNRVLECEKKRAESDAQVWEAKCEELERRVRELERGMPSRAMECSSIGMAEIGLGVSQLGREEANAATPVGDTFRNVTPLKEGEIDNCGKCNLECGGRVGKQLFFGEEMSGKKIAPATPADVGPASRGVIDIDDIDGEADGLNGEAKKVAMESTEGLNVSLILSDEDDVVFHKGTTTVSTHKRKRASNIVASDFDSDPEDHLLISSLRTKSTIDATSSLGDDGKPVIRRRLVRLRNSKASRAYKESSPSHLKSIKTDMSSDEDESESEGESLGSFIVNDSDASDTEFISKDSPFSTSDWQSHGDTVGEFGDGSDTGTNYGKLVARIGRYNDHKWSWKFQAEMQAAFGKDPELCMRAVCALYRKQTSDEKFYKATIVRNNEGFSHCDAYGGSRLGEFLTDRDPEGDLRKSVEELEEYDPEGVEKCRKLALHYSNQLFGSYQSGEDPLWLPSESK